MKNLKELVQNQLKEMAKPATLLTIGNLTKADELINLYAQTEKFKWIGNIIQIVKDAGEDGIVVTSDKPEISTILTKLYREYRENLTSQKVNPPIKRLIDSGVLRRGR
jgi:hypothetical protein